MSCTNCFSGCVETTSDKCVKYTGNDITFLNIHTGDSLEAVEKAITDYLATVYTGEGIFPDFNQTLICDYMTPYFAGDTFTLVDIIQAFLGAICAIEDEIQNEVGRIDTIEAPYTIPDCLSITGTPGTHDTLQAVITKLCEAVGDIDTLYNLYATCITTANISSYIQAYLNTITTNNMMYTKMVPYVVYPFYPSAAIMAGAFDVNGVGLGTWQKVYLCNGYNGLTPDLRGRSIMGMVSGMGGGALDPEVSPANGHPNYTQGQTNGQNNVVLTASQIAAHTHVATTDVHDDGHTTSFTVGLSIESDWDDGGGHPKTGHPITKIENVSGSTSSDSVVTTSTMNKTNITVSTSNAVNTPADQSHTNVHPVLAMYYITYLP